MKRFTEREKEVFKLLAKGLNKEKIAEKLVLSLPTVSQYQQSIYGKLNLSSCYSNNSTSEVRAKAILWYIKQLLDEHIFAGLEPNKRQLKKLREVFEEL